MLVGFVPPTASSERTASGSGDGTLAVADLPDLTLARDRLWLS